MSQKDKSVGFQIQYTLARVETQILGILQSLVGKTFGVKDIYGTRRIQRLHGSYEKGPRVYRGMFCVEGLEWTNIHFCLTEVTRSGYVGSYPHESGLVRLTPGEIIDRTQVIIFIGDQVSYTQKRPNLSGNFVRYFEQRPWETDFQEIQLHPACWREEELWGYRVPPDLMYLPIRSVVNH